MKFLLGTVAHNQHITQILRALYEAGVLGAFYTGGVDVWKSGHARKARRLLGPRVGRRLERRRIDDIPENLVHPNWKWEVARLFARGLRLPSVEDWCWERSEFELDHACAHAIGREDFGGFIGTEFGALTALTQARAMGKLATIVFLSPHHLVRAATVDREYERFPELSSPTTKRLMHLGELRDARRDRESMVSDVVITNSRFTANSLISSGVPSRKILTVPLGCPQVSSTHQPSPNRSTIRFMYSGPVSVRKGAHYLMKAWKILAPKSRAELHFYGSVQLPPAAIADSAGMFFHGHVDADELSRAYKQSDCLVFPTLCDGFGLVVGEAFSNGVPVLTTENAGAADLVRQHRNGLIVPPGDAEALAQGMNWMIENRQLLPQMREEAWKTARNWSWQDFRRTFWREFSNAAAEAATAALPVA